MVKYSVLTPRALARDRCSPWDLTSLEKHQRGGRSIAELPSYRIELHETQPCVERDGIGLCVNEQPRAANVVGHPLSKPKHRPQEQAPNAPTLTASVHRETREPEHRNGILG